MAVNIDKQLLGGLNSDMNIQNVAPIDYLDALNITAKRRQPEAGEDIYPLLGEEYPFANAPDFSQTQIFIRGRRVRVYLPKKNDPSTYPATPLGIFIFRNSNGTPITPTGPSLSGGVTWATLVTDFNIYLGGLLGVNGMSGTATFVATPNNSEYDGYIEIEVVKIGIYTLEFQALYTGYTLPIQIMSDVITTNFYARGGVNKIVGSCRDARGTYLFFSPKPNANMNKPLSAITAVTNTVDLNLASNTVITFAQPHGLYQFERIYIKDCIDSIHINGTWQVYVITTTQVALISSILTIFSPGVGANSLAEFVYDNVSSIGYVSSSELLNAQKAIALAATDTENNFAANLTVLLRPNTRISFTHDNPIDATAKYNNYNAILKWTDNFNKPKMLVYSGDFAVEDGYLYGGGPTVGGVPIPGTENWAGKYRLETLEVTSDLQIADQNFKLSISQTTGGSLKSSNYIYLVAGVTFDGAQTTFGFPTNPISCVAANTQNITAGESRVYTGNVFDEGTNKANILTINNISAGIYEYLRIVCLRYTPLAFELFQFAKIELSSNQTTAIAQHTGNELTIPVSTEEITQTYLTITKALNISELLNTTILSNLTFEADEDLSQVVSAIQYKVKYSGTSSPYGPTPNVLTDAFPLGDYASPGNQPNRMAYMLFETVRCGIIFKRRGGGWTKVYHIDDIRIDDSPTTARRIATLSNFSCDIGNNVPTITFTNLDWDFVLPSGLRLRDVYEDARFVRAEIPPQTLLSGVAYMSAEIAPLTYMAGTSVDPATPVPAGATAVYARSRLYFMTFDGMNSDSFPFRGKPGLQLICCGCPIANFIPAATAPNSDLIEYDSWASDSASYQVLNIIEIENLTQNGSVDIGGVPMVGQDLNGYVTGAYPLQSPLAARIYGVAVDNDIANATSIGNPDIFTYMCFVYDPAPDFTYPINPAESKYYDIGYTLVNAATDTIAIEYDPLGGGNAYGQNTYMGLRNITNETTGTQEYFASIGFRTYNRNNINVSKRTYPGFGLTGPIATLQTCIDAFVSPLSVLESSGGYLQYSLAFTKRVILPALVGYDSNVPEVGTAQATIVWSLPSIENSTWNNDRVFQPLNRRDLELTFGPIWGSFVLNKILVTVQTDYIERQYFDNTGYLISGSGPAILGTGETMGRKGDSIAMIGSSNKWSLFLGMSNSGNQFLYGVDGKRFKFWRVGQDGTTILTDSFKIDYLSKKNLTLAKFFKNPIDNNGITGVYDVKNEAAIWTSIGVAQPVKINGEYWANATSYTAGAIVKDEGCDYLFESVPVLFRAKLNHTSTILNRPRINNSFSKIFWEAIPLTNTDYYNVFTIVYYEDRNVFKTFLSYYHSHMAGFEDTFVVMPNSNRFFQSLATQTITITDVDSIVGNTVTLLVSSTALLGSGVGIYITSLPGTTNMLGYYQFTPSILGPGFYGILSPTMIVIQCYSTPTAPGPISLGTITLTYGTSVAPQSRLYVHRELGQVLRWYPKTYTIPCSPYSYTAGDTKVLIGIQLVSIIPNSDFWENMVLVFDFNKQLREVTKLTEEEIYFDEPLTSSGTLSSLVFEMYLSKDAYVTPVINENRGSLVKFCNFRFNSLEAPYRVDLTTPSHQSYLEEADFVNYDTIHDAPIKMDTTGGFTPDDGESVLFGKYMKVKITFRKLVEQFIHKFGTGVRLMSSEKKRR